MKRVTNMKVRSICLDQNQVNTPRRLPLKHSTIIPVMVKIAKQQVIRRYRRRSIGGFPGKKKWEYGFARDASQPFSTP